MPIPLIRKIRAQLAISIRWLFALTSLLLLTSCTTTNIAGLDRIFFPNSSAKVGPLLSSEEQYPAAEGDVAAVPEDKVQVGAQKIEQKSTAILSEAESLVTSTQAKKQPQAPKVVAKTLSSPPKAAQPAVKVRVSKAPEPKAPEPKAAPPKNATGSISGKLVLIDNNGKPLPAIGTLVSLTPKQTKDSQQSRGPKTHIIDMEQKEYQPRYSTINAGDQVVFVNKDKIQHNVFSSSGGNAFDLGTYGSGLKRAVTLEQPGIVKIYCNIHADMATFVAVGDQNLSTKADEQGRYEINDLSVGIYELSIWNIRGEVKRTVEVKANDKLNLADRIDTAAFKIESHKNKFGGNYSKNTSLFEDEFY